MDRVVQAFAGVLIAVIIGSVIHKQNQEISLLISIGICVMLLLAALAYLEPVMGLLEKIQEMTNLDPKLTSAVLKAVGIALTAQFASLICRDSGNSAMGQGVELLGTAAILWLSIPLLERVLEVVQKIVGDL